MRVGLHANITARPVRSHALLLVLAIIGAGCLATSYVFLWFGIQGILFSFIPGVVLLLFVALAWCWSRRDIDWANSKPFSFTNKDGDTVSTDVRPLMTKGGAERFSSFLSELQTLVNRRPLPPPDGLVDKSGNPIPGSKKDAVAKIDAINEQTQQRTSESIEFLTKREKVAIEAQPSALQPPDFVPHVNINRLGDK